MVGAAAFGVYTISTPRRSSPTSSNASTSLNLGTASVSTTNGMSTTASQSNSSTAETLNASTTSTSISSPSVVVGSPVDHFQKDSYKGLEIDKDVYQTIPLTIYGPPGAVVKLGTAGILNNTWIHLGSSVVTTSPLGTRVDLTVAGATIPLLKPNTFPKLLITANFSSPAQAAVNASVPLALESPAPIVVNGPSDGLLPSSITVQAGLAEPWPTIDVYDPSDPSISSLTVSSLQVLGLVNGSSIQSVPSWLSINFPSPNLVLSAYQPAYLSIHESNTLSLPPSTNSLAPSSMKKFTLAVQETINGTPLTQYVTLYVFPPIQGSL